MDQSSIIWFGDFDCADLSQAGGKGANLGRLTQGGFVVPPGFVVGTAAYAAHVQSNEGLKKKISDALRSINYDNADALEASVLKIRNWIVVGAMARDLELGPVDYIPAYRSPALTGTGLAFATWNTLP